MPHKAREKFRTEHGVFDEFTNQTLFKLSTEGHFDRLLSPISIGKESNVFAAVTAAGNYVAVKIYRLENCDFNRMYAYIKSDPRFIGLLHRSRKIIFAWAQREYRNLLLARDARIHAPLPIAFKNNVLIEEFIGNTSPAPRLTRAPPKNPEKFFKLLLNDLTKLYKNHITHGDLSAFNILNYNETPILIDFSQSTQDTNPIFKELFVRDIKTIVNHFKKLGLELDLTKVINTVTGAKQK